MGDPSPEPLTAPVFDTPAFIKFQAERHTRQALYCIPGSIALGLVFCYGRVLALRGFAVMGFAESFAVIIACALPFALPFLGVVIAVREVGKGSRHRGQPTGAFIAAMAPACLAMLWWLVLAHRELPDLLEAMSLAIALGMLSVGVIVAGILGSLFVRVAVRLAPEPESRGPFCGACRHALVGLTTPRCPECGARFRCAFCGAGLGETLTDECPACGKQQAFRVVESPSRQSEALVDGASSN